MRERSHSQEQIKAVINRISSYPPDDLATSSNEPILPEEKTDYRNYIHYILIVALLLSLLVTGIIFAIIIRLQ